MQMIDDMRALIFFSFFIEHTPVQLTFTKDNVQQNGNYNLSLTKKQPNTFNRDISGD